MTEKEQRILDFLDRQIIPATKIDCTGDPKVVEVISQIETLGFTKENITNTILEFNTLMSDPKEPITGYLGRAMNYVRVLLFNLRKIHIIAGSNENEIPKPTIQ